LLLVACCLLLVACCLLLVACCLLLVACCLLLVACCLLLVACSPAPDLGWLQSSAVLLLGPVPWPRQCSCWVPSSALEVLLLHPVPRPRQCSCWVPYLASAVLGSSALPRYSSLARRCLLCAPHKTFGLASVLFLVSSASPRFSSSASVLGPIPWPRRRSSVPFFGPIPWRCFGAPHKTLGCAPVPRSWCSSSVPTLDPRCCARNPLFSVLQPWCSHPVSFVFDIFATHSISLTVLTQLLLP
jgi:hypothetical protein